MDRRKNELSFVTLSPQKRLITFERQLTCNTYNLPYNCGLKIIGLLQANNWVRIQSSINILVYIKEI